MPRAGRRVGPALGRCADRGDGGRRLRGQRPGALRPLQDRADGRARAAGRGRGCHRRARGERERPRRPPTGPAGRRGRRRALPARRGGLHQGRHPSLVAHPRPAHLGQAGRCLPGLTPAVRHAGDPRPPGRGRAGRGGAARARVSGSCGCATTATPPASRSKTDALAAVVARRAEVVAAVRAAGFAFVALDLEGFRSGSLNRTLAIGEGAPR